MTTWWKTQSLSCRIILATLPPPPSQKTVRSLRTLADLKQNTHRSPQHFFRNIYASACTQLIRRTFTPHELPLLIDAIFSSDDEGDMILRLSGDDAQNFTDVIDEARSPPFLH
jgi:hypothetical protein